MTTVRNQPHGVSVPPLAGTGWVQRARATGLLAAAFAAAAVARSAGGQTTPVADPAPLRAPAVPLVTHDPYLSAWSFADRLTDDWPKHWTGHVHGMCGLVRVDGKPMRFMGTYPGTREAAVQTGVRVLPTRTFYTFDAGPVELAVTFLSPLVMDEL
ncbi:MAG: glutaminase, partial [Phycisphaerales bacterium]|nr:glutaminase [Phycisphaerales bacterium]